MECAYSFNYFLWAAFLLFLHSVKILANIYMSYVQLDFSRDPNLLFAPVDVRNKWPVIFQSKETNYSAWATVEAMF